MKWENESNVCEEGYEVLFSAEYHEKLLGIRVLRETDIQAKLETQILCADQEEQEVKVEYYHVIRLVGLQSTDFVRKLTRIVRAQKLRLEKIAVEDDSVLLD